MADGKIFLMLNEARHHEKLWGSVGMTPSILNYMEVSGKLHVAADLPPREKAPGTNLEIFFVGP
jgi:hypothetical protein